MPVPADVLLLTAVCFTAWCGFWWAAIGVTPFKAVFGGAWFAAAVCWYAMPPFFAARMIARPNREGKNIPQIIASRMRYMTRPRTLDGYVSRRHIRIWLKARDARTRVPGRKDMTGALARCRYRAGSLTRACRQAAGPCLRTVRPGAGRYRRVIRNRAHKLTALRNLRLNLMAAREENDEDTGTQ